MLPSGKAHFCIPSFLFRVRVSIHNFRRGVEPQVCSWSLSMCELQSRCSACLSHALNVLLPLLDALPCSPPSIASAHARTHLSDPCPSPATPPWLSAHSPTTSALLLRWAWEKPMHYLPCLGHCLTYVFPSHEGDLLLLNFSCGPVWGGEQHHQVLEQCPHPSTCGWGARAGRATIVQTHTHSFTERMEPLTISIP